MATELSGESVTALLATQLSDAFISLVKRKKVEEPRWDVAQLAVG